MTSTNYGLNFAPIALTGQTRTQELYINNLRVISDPDDTNTLNLSDLGGNTTIVSNLFVNDDAVVLGNLNIGGNVDISATLKPQVLIVPFASVSVINSTNADLTNINCSNIVIGNNFTSNGNATFNSNLILNGNATFNSNLNLNGRLTVLGNTIINSNINILPDGSLIARNGANISGNMVILNPSDSTDYISVRPSNDTIDVYSNLTIDGINSTRTFKIDNFANISLNDPVNAMELVNATPSSTTNKLYNVNGRLHFNGNTLEIGNISGNYVPIIQQVSNDISKYQTALSYQLDFSSIGSNGTYFYYNSNPYPSVSDLPSFLFIYNAQNASTHLQLYDSTSQRRVGYLDGFMTTIQNDSSHKVAIYFSQKTNPTNNIFNGSTIVNHIDIEPDESIIFVYQATFNYYYIVSRTVNLEAYTMKFENMESVGTFAGTTITATTLGANLALFGNAGMNNLITKTIAPTETNIRLQGNMTIDQGYMMTYSNTAVIQGNQLTDKNYVDGREAVFRANILATQNTWTNTNYFTGGEVRVRNQNLIVDDGSTSKYILFGANLCYTNNTNGTGYTLDGQSNTGDFIFTGYNNLRSNQPIKTNDIKPVGSTLNIAGDNGTATLNLGTADSTQTINIGTGSGATTINIGGGLYDVVNINANVSYTEVNDLSVYDKDILLNRGAVGSGTARGAGVLIRDGGSNVAGKIVVNSSGTGYNVKAPEAEREINLDLPNFGDGLVKCSGNILTSSAGAISDISGLQSALDSKLNLSGGLLTGALQQSALGEAIAIGHNGTSQQLITMGDGSRYFQIGKVADGSSTVGVGTTRAGMSANISANDKLRLIGTNGIEIPQLTASKPLSLDASKNITSGDLSQSVITNLTSDLASKASLSGATFTGAIDVGSYITTRSAPASSVYLSFSPINGKIYQGSTSFNWDGQSLGYSLIFSNLTAVSMLQTLDMNSQKITNLATPTNANDATTKSYVDSQISGNTSAILSSNNTWTGNNTFQANVSITNNYKLNVGTTSGTIILYGGDIVSPSNANPTSINQNGLTFSQIPNGSSGAGCYIQAWNSRKLFLNSLGNDMDIGGTSSAYCNVNHYGSIIHYNNNNTGQYFNIRTDIGTIYTSGYNITQSGQSQGYSYTLTGYDGGINLSSSTYLNSFTRFGAGGEAWRMTRASGDGTQYMTMRNNAETSTYLYWGMESSGGTGIFGLGNNAVVYGSTTNNLLGFYSNNKKTLVMDDGRLFDTVSSPISGKDPYSNTLGQARWRDGVFTGTFDNSKTITNMAYGDDSPITTGVRYTHTVIPDQNWIFSISGTYTNLTAGWYCFKVEWDDEIYMTANEIPFQATTYGSKNLPIYIKFGRLDFNMMVLNQSGAGSMAYRLDLLTALNY